MRNSLPPAGMASLFVLISLILPFPAWSDYEIYRSDGFEKVHEVLEQKENADGTFTLKVRRTKDSQAVTEIPNAVEVKKVEPRSGPQYMDRPTPTPAPKWTPTPQPKPKNSSGGEDVPWVRQLSRTVVLVVMAVVAAFIGLFILVKSSN